MFKFLCLAFLVLGTSQTKASIQVYPTRIFMDERTKITTISVRNTTNSPQTYLAKSVFYRMEADGSMNIVPLPTKDERSLKEHIRFSPKRFSLAPKQEQVIRIMLKRTNGLPSGDYRAHLRIAPDQNLLKDNNSDAGQKFKLKITAQIAVAVGVFYNKGKVPIEVSLNDLSLSKDTKGKAHFRASLTNLGKSFPVGKFQLAIKKEGDQEEIITEISGISSYVKKRFFEYPIADASKLNAKGSILELRLLAPAHLDNKLLAATQLKL